MTVTIRLLHPTKIRGVMHDGGAEVDAPRDRALGLIAVGRAEHVGGDTGGDRMIRETRHAPPTGSIADVPEAGGDE